MFPEFSQIKPSFLAYLRDFIEKLKDIPDLAYRQAGIFLWQKQDFCQLKNLPV